MLWLRLTVLVRIIQQLKGNNHIDKVIIELSYQSTWSNQHQSISCPHRCQNWITPMWDAWYLKKCSNHVQDLFSCFFFGFSAASCFIKADLLKSLEKLIVYKRWNIEHDGFLRLPLKGGRCCSGYATRQAANSGNSSGDGPIQWWRWVEYFRQSRGSWSETNCAVTQYLGSILKKRRRRDDMMPWFSVRSGVG